MDPGAQSVAAALPAVLPDTVAQSVPYVDSAANFADDSPTRLHRMFKYWRNSSAKIPGLRKSESFADYRRHSSTEATTTGRGAILSPRQVASRYQRLESYDEGKLQQMR